VSDEPAVLLERRDRTLVVTINRPDQRNAVKAAVAHGIAAALEELDGDPALTVGVLTGAGKGFCAVVDLKAFRSRRATVRRRSGVCRDHAGARGNSSNRPHP
jgi:enoyl-CoA hydratase